jgi:lipoate-protein ligase A
MPAPPSHAVAPRADRVIDTGIRSGRLNIAFDQALIEAHNAGRIPDTIRFLRFRPSALVGLHQILSHEVRLDFCRRSGVEVGRRITGGGGLYLDEGQIGWELVLGRRRLGTGDLAEIATRVCTAAAAGLRRLGVAAEFRPRNDIEVEGRKISGTGGFIDGATLFYQGTLLVDFDAARMIEVLKVPAEKLAKRDLEDARRRVITVREVLGRVPALEEIYGALLEGFREGLGLRPQWGEPTEFEETLAQRLHERELGTDEFVHLVDAPEADDNLVSATLVRRGGALRADVRLEGQARERIREVLLTGDFFVTPPRALFDLEADLRGRGVAQAGEAVEAFFARTRCELVALTPADFREVIERALRQMRLRAAGRTLRAHWLGPGPEQAPTLVFLHDALGSARMWRDVPERLARASGCGALVYDRWGSGDSEPLARPYRRDYLLHEALDSLPEVLAAAGVRDAILVGQSDGASIALAYAGAHADGVRGIVALAPHLFREKKTSAAIRAQIADFEHGDLKSRLERHHGAKTAALFERLVEAWTAPDEETGWGLDAYVRRIRCPVLAIQGADDEFFSQAQLDALGALLSGRLETLRIPGCGHYPQHQARGAVLAEASRFIRALLQGSAAAAGTEPAGLRP